MTTDIHCIAFDRDEDSLWGHCTCGHSTDEHEGTLGECNAEDDFDGWDPAEALRDSDGHCNGQDCTHGAGTEEG